MRYITSIFLYYILFWVAADACAQPVDALDKARTAYEKQQWAKAERYLDRVLKTEETNTMARYYRVKVYWETKQWEPALADCNVLIGLEPMNAEYYLLRSDAWEFYAMSSMLPPAPCNCPDEGKKLFNSLNESAALQMRYALEDAQKACSIAPQYAEAHYRCGYLEHLFNNEQAACKHFEQAQQLGHPKAVPCVE